MLMFLFVAVAAEDKKVNPDIVYKYSDDFELIWHDGGSGAKYSGSIWRALNYQKNFCSLGDVATAGRGKPTDLAVFVSERKAGALVNPTSFTPVWTDQGSGADADVYIYKMNAPAGYTCLGGVAMNSYRVKPDPKKYCCVKKEYVVQADTVYTWSDSSSGATLDGSLWTVIRASGEAFGLDAGTFIPVPGYSRPDASTVYLLKADESKVRDVWQLPTGEDKLLNLHEVKELEMKLIWNDNGAGATQDVSIWRAESKSGYYPPGDIAVPSYIKPTTGFLLRPTDKNGDVVRPPISYKLIWHDGGSGASMNCRIWSVLCPGGYVALGNVATHGPIPELGSVYCVNSTFTTYGTDKNWKPIWNDNGAGGTLDVTIYNTDADATPSKDLQSVRGFGAAANYGYKPKPPYFLKSESVQYWAEKPIAKIEMYNVEYDLSVEKAQTSPVKLYPTILENNSDMDQEGKRIIEYTYANTQSYTFSQAVQLGVKMEISAGSPIIGVESKTTISMAYTSNWISGVTNTTTHTDRIEAFITTKPNSKIDVYITASKTKADIPYKATLKKIYFDGTHGIAKVSGVYKGVATTQFIITYGETENLPDDARS